MPGTHGRQTLDDLLAAAEARISRLSAGEAYEAMQAGALLIDVRAGENREREGIVPGSLHIPRTVLEWRLDPDSPWRSPHAGGLDRQILLMCDHGYATVLAAATLADLGFTRVGDVVGGFEAWREAGLPTAPAPPRPPGAAGPAGMAGPD